MPAPESAPQWNSAAVKEYWRRKCRDRFRWFVRLCYNIDGHPKGGWWVEHFHGQLTDWFEQHVLEWLEWRAKGIDRQKWLMVVVPRETGKTNTITRCGPLWIWLQDPEASQAIGSEALLDAVKWFTPIKHVLDGSDPYPNFVRLYGSWYAKDREWSQQRMVHSMRKGIADTDPSMEVWGVATGLVGGHKDTEFGDDFVSYERMQQDHSWLDTANGHMSSLGPTIKKNALFCYSGTPYSANDVIMTQLRKHGARSITGMPCPFAEARPNGLYDLFYWSARDYEGKPTIPTIWSVERMERERKEDDTKYNAQILCNPQQGERVPITRDQIDKLWVDARDVPRNLRISVHLDTAFKTEKRRGRGDESVIQVWGHTRDGSGEVYFLEGWSSRTARFEQFNDRLVVMLQHLRRTGRWPFILTDEPDIGGKAGTWENTLVTWCHKAGLPAPTIRLLSRAGTRKYNRIMEAVSYWVDGYVRLVRGAPGVERLVDQALKIEPEMLHDDWVDAAADVFNPAVYTPPRKAKLPGEQLDVLRPYDDELGVRMTIGDIVKADRKRRQQYVPVTPIT